MSKLISISNNTNEESLLDVIFVHGLGGDPHATWGAADSLDKFWPGWLAQDISAAHVWSLSYEAAISSWFGNSMSLTDMGLNLRATLESAAIGKRPIVFVCHSLGGLLVKQILRTSSSIKIAEDGGNIAEATTAVVFFATPHSGSQKATWMDAFRVFMWPSAAAKDLVSNSDQLRDLNFWYRDYAADKALKNQSYYETQKTNGFLIVDPNSADGGIPGNIAIPVAANHINICKPDSRDSLVYKRVLALTVHIIETMGSEALQGALPLIPDTKGQRHTTIVLPEVSKSLTKEFGKNEIKQIDSLVERYGHKKEIIELSNKQIPGLRRFLVIRLQMQEMKVIWYDTFGEDVDEYHPGKSISGCIVAMLIKASKQNLMENLFENIILERPDLADNFESFKFS